MKIKLTTIYVNDQERALRFYTSVLGFAKRADFSQGPFRWLTVVSPDEPEGTELQLALNDNPAAQAYQQAMLQQNRPAAMFYTSDIQGDYKRIQAGGAAFSMPPTAVTGSTIAMLTDTCGNVIQLVQLAGRYRWRGRATAQPTFPAQPVGRRSRRMETTGPSCLSGNCATRPPRFGRR